MEVTRSGKPNYSRIGQWLRNELYRDKDFKLWVLNLYYKQGIKWLNSKK